jgi:hypothetical protein
LVLVGSERCSEATTEDTRLQSRPPDETLTRILRILRYHTGILKLYMPKTLGAGTSDDTEYFDLESVCDV